MSDQDSSSTTATEIAQRNSVFERFARAGYVVSGLLHLAIGYLAIRIAVGSGGGSTDHPGRSRRWQPNRGVSSRSGAPRLRSWMALWRLVETGLGRSTGPGNPRADRQNCWIGQARWRWPISRSRTRRSDSPGAPRKSTGTGNSGIQRRP